MADTGNYPGIPAVVTPAKAEWLEKNHPRYEEFKGVIEARLAEYNDEQKAIKDASKEAAKEGSDAKPATPATPKSASTVDGAGDQGPKAEAGGK